MKTPPDKKVVERVLTGSVLDALDRGARQKSIQDNSAREPSTKSRPRQSPHREEGQVKTTRDIEYQFEKLRQQVHPARSNRANINRLIEDKDK